MIVRIEGDVSGRVQGVGFRWSMAQQAERLGLGGWCRNTPDGRVAFAVEGDEVRVTELTAWLDRGPAWACVEAVSLTAVTPVGERSFMVR